MGSDNVSPSTTCALAKPKDLRVSSCAHTPPYRPPAAPITASGLPASTLSPYGRDSQSIAFFITAGMLPLYSGVDAVDVFAIERDVAEALIWRDGDAAGRVLGDQFCDLPVDRSCTQASDQR